MFSILRWPLNWSNSFARRAEEKAAERELRAEMTACLGRVAAVRAQAVAAEAKVRELLRLEKPPLVAHSNVLGEQPAQAEPKSVLVTNSHRCGAQLAVPSSLACVSVRCVSPVLEGQTTPESGSDGDASSDVAVVRRPWASSWSPSSDDDEEWEARAVERQRHMNMNWDVSRAGLAKIGLTPAQC